MMTSQPVVIMALEPQTMTKKKSMTRSTMLFVIVAFAFATQKEKKQRWRGDELLVVLALSFTGLERKNQDNDELNLSLSWL
jgi:hypothetical protein